MSENKVVAAQCDSCIHYTDCDSDFKNQMLCNKYETRIHLIQRNVDNKIELKFKCPLNKRETGWIGRDVILDAEPEKLKEIAGKLHIAPKKVWMKAIGSYENDNVLGFEEKEKLDDLINSVAIKIDADEDMGEIRYEIAKWLLENYDFATLSDSEEIYRYMEGVYVDKAETWIKHIVNLCLKHKATTYQANEVVNYVKRATYIDREEFEHENLLCVGNGILDLETKEVFPHTPTRKFFCKIPVKYEEDVKCPKILKFLKQVVTVKQLPLIQEILGYCLSPTYEFHKALMLIGEGSNGKSTLLSLFKHFLGKDNIANVSLQSICNNRFASSHLQGKLANIYADLPDKALRYTGTFKMLTGGDTIQGERKWHDAFEFVNHAKLLFSTNKIPETGDDTLAFFRRWIIISCPNTFIGEKRDPNILEKLTTEKELTGLLNWALEGLTRLQEKGGFSDNKTMNERREQYIKASNSAKAFIETRLEFDPDPSPIPKNTVYRLYIEFCKKENIPAKRKAEFTKTMNMEMPNITDAVSTTKNRKSVRVWKNLHVKGYKNEQKTL